MLALTSRPAGCTKEAWPGAWDLDGARAVGTKSGVMHVFCR